jgi:hypothetical protein
VRITDTRYGNGTQLGAVGQGGTLPVQGAGIFGVPHDATALLTGLVAVSGTAVSYLEVYPGATPPASPTSTLNSSAGRTVANAAVANLGAPKSAGAGQFGIYNDAGTVQVVADLFGYFR